MSAYETLTADIATLGLLLEEADTMAGVGVRLGEQFPRARWPRSTPHKHLPALASKGFVRRVSRGNVSSLDRFEVTAAGKRYLRNWIRSTVSEPAVQRDAILAKIALCATIEDVLGVIDAVRVTEEIYAGEYAAAHARSIAAGRARMQMRRAGQHEDLRSRLRDINIAGEAELWDCATKRLEQVREALELLVAEHRSGRQR